MGFFQVSWGPRKKKNSKGEGWGKLDRQNILWAINGIVGKSDRSHMVIALHYRGRVVDGFTTTSAGKTWTAPLPPFRPSFFPSFISPYPITSRLFLPFLRGEDQALRPCYVWLRQEEGLPHATGSLLHQLREGHVRVGLDAGISVCRGTAGFVRERLCA